MRHPTEIIGTLMALAIASSSSLSAQCTEDGAVGLAFAYRLAMPMLITQQGMAINDGSELRRLAQQFPVAFGPNGDATRCAAWLGPTLVRRGFQSYDRGAYGRVMENAPAEIAHMAPDVADRMNGGAVDLMLTGQEIIWLAQIFPDAARGDLRSFQTTGTMWRQQVRQTLPIVLAQLQMLCAMDPWSCEMMNQMMPGIAEMTDEVSVGMIYALARMAGR